MSIDIHCREAELTNTQPRVANLGLAPEDLLIGLEYCARLPHFLHCR